MLPSRFLEGFNRDSVVPFLKRQRLKQFLEISWWGRLGRRDGCEPHDQGTAVASGERIRVRGSHVNGVVLAVASLPANSRSLRPMEWVLSISVGDYFLAHNSNSQLLLLFSAPVALTA